MFFGYLEPGSGSLILQALLGGIAGIVVFGRAWKARLLGKKSDSATKADAESSEDESALSES